MQLEIAERRHARLLRQFDVLSAEFDRHDSHVSSKEIDALLAPLEELLSEIENRKQSLEEAPDTVVAEFYDRYVAGLDDVDMRLDNLHEVIGYIELHSRQRTEDAEVIDDIRDVCNEICTSFGTNPSILPIIWRSYAMLPIGDGDTAIHCLFLPRHSRPRQYQPVIAHEIGHVLHDEVGPSDEFRERVWEIDDSWSSNRGEFAGVWMEWFHEFFCDACGAISFGPAYVQAMSDYLHNSKPYRINTGSDHPPMALRFKLIEAVATDAFPDSAKILIEESLEELNHHLFLQERYKDPKYDSYVVEDLLDLISIQVQSLVSNDLEAIIDAVMEDLALDDVSEDIYYRVKINREWFQNGG